MTTSQELHCTYRSVTNGVRCTLKAGHGSPHFCLDPDPVPPGDDTPAPTEGEWTVTWEAGIPLFIKESRVHPISDVLAALNRAGAAPDLTALQQAVIDAAESWADADFNGPDYAAILANLYHAVIRYRAALVHSATRRTTPCSTSTPTRPRTAPMAALVREDTTDG